MPKIGCGMIAFRNSLLMFGDLEYHKNLQNLNHLSRIPDSVMV